MSNENNSTASIEREFQLNNAITEYAYSIKYFTQLQADFWGHEQNAARLQRLADSVTGKVEMHDTTSRACRVNQQWIDNAKEALKIAARQLLEAAGEMLTLGLTVDVEIIKEAQDIIKNA